MYKVFLTKTKIINNRSNFFSLLALRSCFFFSSSFFLFLFFFLFSPFLSFLFPVTLHYIYLGGHIKLIDFGFAKHIGFGRTFTRCGSPEYVSPEIVLNRGHGLQTDIWSFGVTMYEMIAGYLPFGDEDTHPLEMSRDITCGNYICEEDLFSSTVRDLLSNCLNIDPQKRDDPGALKNHAWFQKQFLPESKINKGEQGWKPTRILSTNRAVPKGLIPIVGSDNDDRNFEKYPDSIEETALVVAGNNELQFQGFGG